MTMSDENWMTSDELRSIADHCDALQPIWDLLTSNAGATGGVAVESEGLDFWVYDSNGDKLGKISWGDSGAVFFMNRDSNER
jgi:hypothetical protein